MSSQIYETSRTPRMAASRCGLLSFVEAYDSWTIDWLRKTNAHYLTVKKRLYDVNVLSTSVWTVTDFSRSDIDIALNFTRIATSCMYEPNVNLVFSICWAEKLNYWSVISRLNILVYQSSMQSVHVLYWAQKLLYLLSSLLFISPKHTYMLCLIESKNITIICGAVNQISVDDVLYDRTVPLCEYAVNGLCKQSFDCPQEPWTVPGGIDDCVLATSASWQSIHSSLTSTRTVLG
jgi:hypothetical protein